MQEQHPLNPSSFAQVLATANVNCPPSTAISRSTPSFDASVTDLRHLLRRECQLRETSRRFQEATLRREKQTVNINNNGTSLTDVNRPDEMTNGVKETTRG